MHGDPQAPTPSPAPAGPAFGKPVPQLPAWRKWEGADLPTHGGPGQDPHSMRDDGGDCTSCTLAACVALLAIAGVLLFTYFLPADEMEVVAPAKQAMKLGMKLPQLKPIHLK